MHVLVREIIVPVALLLVQPLEHSRQVKHWKVPVAFTKFQWPSPILTASRILITGP